MSSERANEAAATEDFEFMALSEARHYRAMLLKEFRPWLHGSVLEVGAGVGHWFKSLKCPGSFRWSPTRSSAGAFGRPCRSAN